MIRRLFSNRQLLSCIIGMLCLAATAGAQQTIVDMSAVDGVDLTPDNLFSFQVQLLDPQPVEMVIRGTVQYRNSDLRIAYSFRTKLQPGLNSFSQDRVAPQFEFSSGALRELFQVHKIMPFGTYQYCVSLTTPGSEQGPGGRGDCIYRQSEDQFMITLVDPENNAKLHEFNPQLSWVATYSFSSELSYRLRVAEIKQGQNTAGALARNNPIYEERNLMQTAMVYPVYARPLKAWQPYAWTVDAYYKGILLGGAEPWKFTIVEDSVFKDLPDQSSYIDINIDEGSTSYYAVGNVKLKYTENDFLQNELRVVFLRNGKEIKRAEGLWKVKRGDNFSTYDLTDVGMRHKEDFEVVVEFKQVKGKPNSQTIKYVYVNPDFVN